MTLSEKTKNVKKVYCVFLYLFYIERRNDFIFYNIRK